MPTAGAVTLPRHVVACRPILALAFCCASVAIVTCWAGLVAGGSDPAIGAGAAARHVVAGGTVETDAGRRAVFSKGFLCHGGRYI